MRQMKVMDILATAFLLAAVAVSGCVSYVPPDPPPNWTRLLAERIPELGDRLLASSIVGDANCPIMLKVGGMADSTRHSVGASLLMDKFRAYIVANGGGRVQVFDTSAEIEKFRFERIKASMRVRFKADISLLAGQINNKYRRRNIKIVVQEVVNQRNVGNVCADGFVSLLRDEIMAKGMGNITFLEGDRREDADYVLGGEFSKLSLSGASAQSGDDSRDEQKLRVTFADAATGDVDFEASVVATKADFVPSLGATFVLSGRLDEISKEHLTATDDYVRMEFRLVDPDSTVVKWIGGADVAITTNKTILYY